MTVRGWARRARWGRWARWSAVAGGAAGVLAGGYLVETSADKHVISILHNEAVRRADLGFGALAMALAAVAVVVALTARHWAAGWALGLLALGFVAAAGRAVDASDQPDRLAGLVGLVLPSALLLGIGGLLWCVAGERPRLAVGAFVSGGAVLAAGIAATSLEDPIDQAQLFAGLQPGWEVEDDVDNVFVDDAGRVWGVRPWAAMEVTALHLRDVRTGRFEPVRTRGSGWPPAVVGSDADGRTWFVSSDAADPFAPLVEVHRSGRIAPAPAPDRPLPPLDAVALDRGAGILFGLHSDFAVPAVAVLEVLEGATWTTVATPISHAGRFALVDAAVGTEGELWVWHDGEPDVLHRYDGTTWRTRRLPFDLEPTTERAPAETALDPFRTFIRDGDGHLWVFDREVGRLVGIHPDGSVRRGRRLPADATPLVVDRDGFVWCRSPSGLVVVDDDGVVRYDSAAAGMPDLEVESVAVDRSLAWVRGTLGDGTVLLRFDHGDVIDR